MNTKNIVIAGVIILIGIAGGYFLFSENSSGDRDDAQAPSTLQENATSTEAGAKINIDAVCQGALAYTTFPDAASADAFVADCKEGKHPEVIEHYKAEMNLGAGAQI